MTDTKTITAETILKYQITITQPDPEDADGEIVMESVQETSYTALKAALRADFDLPNHRPLDVKPGKFGRPSTAGAAMWGADTNVSIYAEF